MGLQDIWPSGDGHLRRTVAVLLISICLSSSLAASVTPKRELAAFCEEKQAGPYIDDLDPRCFVFCYPESDAKATAGYRSCCETNTCFSMPSTVYPLGVCAACPKKKAEGAPTLPFAEKMPQSSAPSRQPQRTTIPSFAGGPLRRPDTNERDDKEDKRLASGGSPPDMDTRPDTQHSLDLETHASRYTPVQEDSEINDRPGDRQQALDQESHASSYAPVQEDSKSADRSLWVQSPAPAPFDLWGAVVGLGKEISVGLLPGTPSPAPPPQKEESWPPAPAPAPLPFDLPMVTRPLLQTPQLPINSVEEFSGLTEKQLFDIFTQGVADIPSDLPGERGKFAICNRTNTLIPNGFGTRPGGTENASLPHADELFNIMQVIWNGKVMYTDPASGKTTLWNLLLDQSTVDVLGSVTADDPGIAQDKKPSVIINYGLSDIPAARVIRDEMRRVGPVTWLGRAYFINPILAALPTSNETSFIVKALEPFTKMSSAVVDVVEGVANATAASPITTPPPGYLPITLYFSCDCQSYFAPKLHYFPLLAEPLTAIQRATGYVDPLYSLPSLTGPSGPDPNAATLAQKNNSDVEPFVLWPYNLANPKLEGLRNIRGFLQLPARMFTRIFGTSWLPNLPVKGGWNPDLPPRSEGFSKGQAKLAETIIYNRESRTQGRSTARGQ